MCYLLINKKRYREVTTPFSCLCWAFSRLWVAYRLLLLLPPRKNSGWLIISRPLVSFLSLDTALEIDLSHLLWLIAAIVVLVLAGQFVFVFAIIAHHSILDVRTYRIDQRGRVLRWRR